MIDPNVHTLDWLEVRDKFLALAGGQKWSSQPAAHTVVNENRDLGGTIAETCDWIRNGYHVPGLQIGDIDYAPRRRKRASWSEDDGDIDVGRLHAGADAFYLTRAEKLARPGLAVEVGLSFFGGVRPEILTAYGRWLASVISSLEADGYDLEVALFNRCDEVFRGRNAAQTVRMIVKRPNEVSDFTSWSAMFSPSGLRRLMWTAKCLAADRCGCECSPSFGVPRHNGWSVNLDNYTLTVEPHTGARSDPSAELTTLAKAAGVL
jgi:hypothetical protein